MTGQTGMRNLLEPLPFAALFNAYPPEGFASVMDQAGTPLFFTDFDLLTTVEPALRARLAKLPCSAALTRALTFPSCFAGTTITEFAPLPETLSPQNLLNGLLARYGGKQSFLILKDLPNHSPLLPDTDNAYAAELAKVASERGLIEVEGQALGYLPLDFGNTAGYLSRLSSGRRKDLRRKLKIREALDVEIMRLGDSRFQNRAFQETLYAMYREVYAQSLVHFDLLSPAFFAALLCSRSIGGVVVCYRHKGVLAGYNICLIHKGMFIDKYIGFRYPLARELNLYFVSWLVNLEIALQNGCSTYVAGWTDPEVKASLGVRFTFTRHLVWVKNPALRYALYPLRRFFESDGRALGKKT